MGQRFDKQVLIGLLGERAGTKLFNWLDPCCDSFCEDVNACGSLMRASVHISSAEILNIATAPVPVGLPLPGVGYIYRVISAQAKLNFNTTPYATAGRLDLIGGASVSEGNRSMELDQFVTANANRISSFGTALNSVITENSDVYVTTGGNPTAGDSTIDVYVLVEKVKL